MYTSERARVSVRFQRRGSDMQLLLLVTVFTVRASSDMELHRMACWTKLCTTRETPLQTR